MVVSLWLWNRVTGDRNVKKLQAEIKQLRAKVSAPEMMKIPEMQRSGNLSEEVQL